MFDPFQALAWFAEVKVPTADTSSLRSRAEELRAFAASIATFAKETEKGVAAVLKANDSDSVRRYAGVWTSELAPRYQALQQDLEDMAADCEAYAAAVDEHRDRLWFIGTQLAAMAFTLLFGYIYPLARLWAQRAFAMLQRQAKLEQTIFQKIVKMILEKRIGQRRVGAYVVREGLDALADSVLWAGLKTTVHVASSAATGQPIGNVFEYAGKHFAAEMAYNVGIKGLSDVRRFIPADTLGRRLADTTLGTDATGKFIRRTLAAATVYPLVASGSMSEQGALRSALAHAPRAFILRR
ncbi:hypothetical protein ABZ897_11445 [Nonomuraea sp. NPDC046802]|uniref:hypothetical protein n=1 Tax=Nonomuraea sp. NPDC046802 TaxID=3154919 RepID=UPI0033F7EEF6